MGLEIEDEGRDEFRSNGAGFKIYKKEEGSLALLLLNRPDLAEV